ncbi:hypothetical protein ACQPZG_31745 [Streptomyces sp. CA-294286]|uniref:hypothetical protein n=1 Tax=Streptomyces sp. CA-294286 TaxID=3240070 RepID=UPI003D8F94CA
MTAAGLCALLSACGTTAPDAAPTPAASKPAAKVIQEPPALSPEQARDIVARHAETSRKAYTSLDNALLDTVEDGPLLTQSLARIKGNRGVPEKERAPYPLPTGPSAAQLYIPRIAPQSAFATNSKPRWFAAATTVGPDVWFTVFAERPAQQRWEAVSSVLLVDQPVPKIALDGNGFATAVDANGLPTKPDALKAAVIDNYATGGQQDAKKILTPTSASERQVKIHATAGKGYGDKARTTFAGAASSDPTYALRTADGGTLVLFSHTHTQTDTVTQRGLGLIPKKRDEPWLGTKPLPAIQFTFLCADAATVPHGSGPARLLDTSCARTDVSGPRTRV